MRLSRDDAIFSAAAYADIFDYPLTEEEVHLWMPYKVSFARPGLAKLKEETFKIRAKRVAWCKEKWDRAKKVAAFLRFIPTIQLVGVTGGLAMNNAKKEDDIDLFFIASRGTVWITRLLVTCAVECLGIRRIPGEKDVHNKICLNMFMGDDALLLPKDERDFFAAHEVLQMVPLWERGIIYQKFLRANRWAERFLPNAWNEKNQKYKSKIKKNLIKCAVFFFKMFEPIAKVCQLWYMKKRRTNEVVSNSVIRFHPRDARIWIKKAFAKRLAKRNVPLDKIFYGR